MCALPQLPPAAEGKQRAEGQQRAAAAAGGGQRADARAPASPSDVTIVLPGAPAGAATPPAEDTRAPASEPVSEESSQDGPPRAQASQASRASITSSSTSFVSPSFRSNREMERWHADPTKYLRSTSMMRWQGERLTREDLGDLRMVGSGAFGMVYRGRVQAKGGGVQGEPPRWVALKVLESMDNRTAREDFMSELNLMRLLNHPNLVRCLGGDTRQLASPDEESYSSAWGASPMKGAPAAGGSIRDGGEQGAPPTEQLSEQSLAQGLASKEAYVVTEWLGGGTLARRIFNPENGFRMSERTILRNTLQVTRGLVYLHSCEPCVVHRDIKPANLIFADDGHTLKLADFGLARFIDDDDMTGVTGSFRWMAPEVLKGQAYGPPVDLYSLGMVVYSMISSEMPFPHKGELQAATLMAQGLRPVLPRSTSPDLTEIVRACWAHDSEKRPTASAVAFMCERALRLRNVDPDAVPATPLAGAAGAAAPGCGCAIM